MNIRDIEYGVAIFVVDKENKDILDKYLSDKNISNLQYNDPYKLMCDAEVSYGIENTDEDYDKITDNDIENICEDIFNDSRSIISDWVQDEIFDKIKDIFVKDKGEN